MSFFDFQHYEIAWKATILFIRKPFATPTNDVK